MQDAATDDLACSRYGPRRNGMGRIKDARTVAISPCCTTYSMLPLWRGLFWGHCLTRALLCRMLRVMMGPNM